LTHALRPGPFIPSVPIDNKEVLMKALMIATLLALATSTSAFAQSTTEPAAAAPVAVGDAGAQTGQWAPPDGQTIAPKTRAQVYQELVQAEQDGQLAYLNSTVYAHP
jgi:hypothetical protein